MTPSRIYSRIAGTGSYLPARVMENAEFAQRLDTSDEWIRSRTGIERRHIAEPAPAHRGPGAGVERSRARGEPQGAAGRGRGGRGARPDRGRDLDARLCLPEH